jgi:hypothetical protein
MKRSLTFIKSLVDGRHRVFNKKGNLEANQPEPDDCVNSLYEKYKKRMQLHKWKSYFNLFPAPGQSSIEEVTPHYWNSHASPFQKTMI